MDNFQRPSLLSNRNVLPTTVVWVLRRVFTFP